MKCIKSADVLIKMAVIGGMALVLSACDSSSSTSSGTGGADARVVCTDSYSYLLDEYTVDCRYYE